MTLTKEQAHARALDTPGWPGEQTITEITRLKNGEGWSIESKGHGFFLSEEKLGDALPPKIGDIVLLYTYNGSMIRGVDLRGEPLYYKTDAELGVERQEWIKKHDAEKRARFKKNRRRLDRQFSSLPDVFQRRISWFRAWNPDFRWKDEEYEMSSCVDAVKIATAMKTPKGVQRFSKMRYKTQHKKVPDLYAGHSDNSFGMAVRLAYLYLTDPLLVIAEHGALTPLVGCEEYGCIHPRPPDVVAALKRKESP